eukprot:3882110-Amphidinium_carterae.1
MATMNSTLETWYQDELEPVAKGQQSHDCCSVCDAPSWIPDRSPNPKSLKAKRLCHFATSFLFHRSHTPAGANRLLGSASLGYMFWEYNNYFLFDAMWA